MQIYFWKDESMPAAVGRTWTRLKRTL